MLITVVTVCFNSAKTIRRALDSVRAQTYRPLELVVVDGGSSDETMAIVGEYSDITGEVVSEADSGIYDAMNKAIKLAQGDVIYFLNSDDCFSDCKVLEEVVSVFGTGTCDMVYGDVICVKGSTRIRKDQRLVTSKNILFEGLCHQSIFARSEFMQRTGSFDLSYKICADFDWVNRAFHMGGRVIHIPRVIANYSMEGVSERNIYLRRLELRLIQEKYYHPFFSSNSLIELQDFTAIRQFS